MEMVFLNRDIETLRSRIKGMLLLPGDEQYNRFNKAWNLIAIQKPALIAVPVTAEDIQVVVQFANERNIGIGVMATGHGIGVLCNGGILINTSCMRDVTIDPVAGRATVGAGALWKDVIVPASEYGFATLAGSAPHVGVIGYTMGGGFGYLGRKYGLNANAVTGAEVVTANGGLLHVSAEENEDLFWGVKGGGGNFGVVTSLTFRLFPVKTVYGGAVFYAVENGYEALSCFARWADTLPDEITAAFAFMNIPNLPAAPEPLRGRSVVVIKGCYCGEQPERGEQFFAPVRNIAVPIADSFSLMPVTAMDSISKDPVDPMGVMQYGGMVASLFSKAIETIVNVAGKDSASPLLMVELRRLGGMLQCNPGGIQLMGDKNAMFSINAVGATLTPQMATSVQSHLAMLKSALAPYETNEVFLNFLEAEPSAERVRAAYTKEQWERLRVLKSKYDPKNVFRFNRNIPAA
ncbi:MAG: FAD-binding oxidoreductase [Chitinophagaceae bacterium]|nr:FAD-binding oxidoreductase [Chitinophagaceae bacterium]